MWEELSECLNLILLLTPNTSKIVKIRLTGFKRSSVLDVAFWKFCSFRYQFERTRQSLDKFSIKLFKKIRINWRRISFCHLDCTHLSISVRLVSELHLRKWDRLLHPMCPEVGWLWMHVNGIRWWNFCLATRHPFSIHVFPPVAVMYEHEAYSTVVNSGYWLWHWQ